MKPNALLRDLRLQAGFGLVEILVAMVIGMVTVLAIMQSMSVFEGQKRGTGGANEAQTNGSIALYTLQRSIQQAGFDLPIYSGIYRPLSCTPEPMIDHDGNAATAPIGIYPVVINDGGMGPGGSDTILVLGGFDNPPAGQIGQATSGVPERITQLPGGRFVGVVNNLGCRVGDIALVMQSSQDTPAPACVLRTVTSLPLPDTTRVELDSIAGINLGDGISCMSGWTQRTYSASRVDPANVTDNRYAMMEDTTMVTTDIVNIQAQYGLSNSAADAQIVDWVDATGPWAAPSPDDRKRIKAIRIAVISRSNLLEREPVSTACSSPTDPNPTGVCAWAGTAADPAPVVDLSNTPNWDRYRYRVFETIIPLRNVILNINVI
jgi:type IV pilus assembly protein PilW